MYREINDSVMVFDPAQVLDLKSMVGAGNFTEDFYCSSRLDLAALSKKTEKLVGRNYELLNYLYLPGDTVQQLKVSLEELNSHLAQYEFFKGSNRTPIVYSMTTKNGVNTHRHLIDTVLDRKVYDQPVVNQWVLLKIDGHWQAVFCNRIINEGLIR